MLLALASTVAVAALTGTWTGNGTSSATTSVLGIAVTHTGTSSVNYANDTFNTSNFWSDPYGDTVAGGPSLLLQIPAVTTAITHTVTFSEPVNNPVLHVDRLGGTSGNSNSAAWTLSSSVSQGGTVTLTRLAGNSQFVLTGSTFKRQEGVAGTSGTECTTTTAGAACGSIQFNGTGITSLTFSVVMVGAAGAGDGLELRWSFAGSSVIVRKQSNGGTGSFSFSGSNGVGSFVLDTAGANPASSATFPVSDHTQQITINETLLPNNFTLNGASCVEQGSGAAIASTLAGTSLSIAPSDYGGNQTIVCTFVNRLRQSNLSVTKTNSPANGPTDQTGDTVLAGSTVNYRIVVANGGPDASDGAVLRDPAPTGLNCTAASCGSPTGGAVCPTVTVAALQSASGVTIATLPANSSLAFTLTCTVQ
ncbi:DUF11 domain-containing protein [Luteimonas aquatica]|uniref:DUF11 domain-containing protein n=1 Tax=Luteimonas aquatica TaxID=450364 RepID=UPI001F59D436|nr:DUF11 domain-containing protein [Luteimonas aquatica]